MIKCACGNPECKIAIRLDNNHLWFTDKDGEETLMYLDANTVLQTIKELRVALHELSKEI